MPSTAREELDRALEDVEQVIDAHQALTGGRAGRPAEALGAPVTRAGVVLLVAATEAFVEDLFKEAVECIWPNHPDKIAFLEATVGQRAFANPSAHKTNMLFFNIGIPWVLQNIRWQKRSNASFVASLNLQIKRRNEIAHGDRPRPSVQLRQLRAWHQMISLYGVRLEALVVDQVEEVTGNRPNW